MMCRADYMLEQIEKAFSSLSEYPERENYPMELLDMGFENTARSSLGSTASSIG